MAASIGISISGVDEAAKALSDYAESKRKRLRQVIRASSRDVANATRRRLRSAGSGRMYGAHQASAPGEPPARLTGRLSESVRMRHSGDLASHVIIDDYRASFLEFGTRSGMLLPRPSLGPSADEVKPDHNRRVAAAMRSL